MRSLLRRVLWFVAGAAIAYLFDPITGRKRRADLTAQAKSRVSDAGHEVRAKARYQAGVARGWAHEAFVPETPPASEAELLQKVRSEAVGPTRGKVGHVGIEIEGDVVHLVGTSIDRAAEMELAERIAAVTGVGEVRNELVPV